MIKEAIAKILDKGHLTAHESYQVMDEIMCGESTPAQIASFLTALRIKGETVDEISSFAKVMREHALTITPKVKKLVDTCGTGGDHAHTFNISTAAALVTAGAGVAVAKHGNRSVSSKCGSADILEALGVKVDIAPEKVVAEIEEIGFGFIFAPLFHKAMKYAAPVRREMGIRTVFNVLGPLTNPAGAKAQVLGVFNPHLTEVIAETLLNLGVERAMVVHGMDGLDEISLSDKTKVSELKDKKITTYYLEPEEVGLKKAGREKILGGGVKENLEIISNILSGREEGPALEIVLLNAAAAIMVGGAARDLKEGILKAREAVKSGRAQEVLEKLVSFSRGAD